MRLAAFVTVLAVALGLAPAARAQAAVGTCVTVQTARGDAREIERLVRNEVARHPTHLVVEQNCRTHLTVELIEVQEGRFLTGRVDAEVPQRVRVEDKAGGLVPAIEELLKVVLHNDPLILEGPRQESWLAASMGKLRQKGQMLFEVEAFEWGAMAGGRPWQMPGLALRVRREVGAWHVGARVAGAWRPHDGERVVEPVADIAGHAEVAVYASALADTSGYASAMVGIEHQRFSGPVPVIGPLADGTGLATGLSFALRGGVELLRTTDVRFDLFAQVFLPAFITHDVDGEIIHAWVPSAMIGGGAAF